MNPKLESANSPDSEFNHCATDPGAVSSAPSGKPNDDEPELLFEADLPSDGHDEQGEKMILDLPERPELSGPPSTHAPPGSPA